MIYKSSLTIIMIQQERDSVTKYKYIFRVKFVFSPYKIMSFQSPYLILIKSLNLHNIVVCKNSRYFEKNLPKNGYF